ncbi:MAG: hypothetical protein Q8O89_06395 [Nanoarchaeota archaeon]|nr:hypothetical protein [Nanoarchaeota archaeon]
MVDKNPIERKLLDKKLDDAKRQVQDPRYPYRVDGMLCFYMTALNNMPVKDISRWMDHRIQNYDPEKFELDCFGFYLGSNRGRDTYYAQPDEKIREAYRKGNHTFKKRYASALKGMLEERIIIENPAQMKPDDLTYTHWLLNFSFGVNNADIGNLVLDFANKDYNLDFPIKDIPFGWNVSEAFGGPRGNIYVDAVTSLCLNKNFVRDEAFWDAFVDNKRLLEYACTPKSLPLETNLTRVIKFADNYLDSAYSGNLMHIFINYFTRQNNLSLVEKENHISDLIGKYPLSKDTIPKIREAVEIVKTHHL